MTESVDRKLQIAVVALAGELDYGRAAKRLRISPSELNRQISTLEDQLTLRIFRANGRTVELTEAGQVFVRACRRFLAIR